MSIIRFLFGSEEEASRLLHKVVWTAVQSGLGVLGADALLGVSITGVETVAVAALSAALVVVKEYARKHVDTEV